MQTESDVKFNDTLTSDLARLIKLGTLRVEVFMLSCVILFNTLYLYM